MRCRACSEEHPSHLRCDLWARQKAATSGVVSPEAVATPSRVREQHPHVNEPMVDRDSPARNAQVGTAGPVEKAREFLKKVGRPKLNRTPEEKRKMRSEYMRKRYHAKRG